MKFLKSETINIKRLPILVIIALMAFFILLHRGVAQAGDMFVDDDTCPAIGDGSVTTPFCKIGDAIAAAIASDTINVAAGTYNEHLTINKSLVFLGAQVGVDPTVPGGRTGAESIITEAGLPNPNPDVLIEIPSGTTDVTIDGFTLNGDPTNTIADTSIVRAWDDDITISNNIMNGRVGVLYNSAAANVDGVTITHNLITVNKNGVVMFANPSTNLVISGNVFLPGTSLEGDPAVIQMTAVFGGVISDNTGSGFVTGKSGVGGSNLHNLDIYGNSFTGGKDSISIFGGSTFLDIYNNELSDNTRHGINIKGQDISITSNNILDNNNSGINIDSHVIDTERVKVSCNNISGNANFGVNNAVVTEIINAENNWWGAGDGPSGVGPGSSGDAVSTGVDFSPFLTSPAGDTCGVLDHFVCYEIDDVTTLDVLPVSLLDQFGIDPEEVKVQKVHRLCTPVDKNGEGIFHSFAHLVCYNIVSRKSVNQNVLVNNQFGEQTLRVQGPRTLCVPSTKEIIEE